MVERRAVRKEWRLFSRCNPACPQLCRGLRRNWGFVHGSGGFRNNATSGRNAKGKGSGPKGIGVGWRSCGGASHLCGGETIFRLGLGFGGTGNGAGSEAKSWNCRSASFAFIHTGGGEPHRRIAEGGQTLRCARSVRRVVVV